MHPWPLLKGWGTPAGAGPRHGAWARSRSASREGVTTKVEPKRSRQLLRVSNARQAARCADARLGNPPPSLTQTQAGEDELRHGSLLLFRDLKAANGQRRQRESPIRRQAVGFSEVFLHP